MDNDHMTSASASATTLESRYMWIPEMEVNLLQWGVGEEVDMEEHYAGVQKFYLEAYGYTLEVAELRKRYEMQKEMMEKSERLLPKATEKKDEDAKVEEDGEEHAGKE